MFPVLTDRSVSISEFTADPAKVIQEADRPVVVFEHDRPAFYLVPPDVFEDMMRRLEAGLQVTGE